MLDIGSTVSNCLKIIDESQGLQLNLSSNLISIAFSPVKSICSCDLVCTNISSDTNHTDGRSVRLVNFLQEVLETESEVRTILGRVLIVFYDFRCVSVF